MRLIAAHLASESVSRAQVARLIAARLVEAGWRFRRGSTAPWIEPGDGDDATGYSLIGAAARQAEIEGATNRFKRHADA